jgi:hypothetical protein
MFHLFEIMLKIFHLDVSKVDQAVAQRDRWLVDNGLPQPPVADAEAQL